MCHIIQDGIPRGTILQLDPLKYVPISQFPSAINYLFGILEKVDTKYLKYLGTHIFHRLQLQTKFLKHDNSILVHFLS
jgi:hypothetical protein